jgi:hypothetical protein
MESFYFCITLWMVEGSLYETPVPPYPFCHIGVDVSGPYPTTLSGNKYIIGFIDLYSGWPEAFSVPAKTTDNVAHLHRRLLHGSPNLC